MHSTAFCLRKASQTNGLVERANRSLGEGMKARLGKDNKNWVEEISHVLWAHRTMVKSSNGDTPFSLTYRTEDVIPTKIRMPTFRTAEVDMAKNDEALKINLELLEEKREQAAITEAKSKRTIENFIQCQVRTQALSRRWYTRTRSKPRGRYRKARTQVGRPIRSHRSTWEGIVQAKRPQRKGASADMECL
ncbi:reverse transcriptase domain-containing protein [Tanacetum coccineum]